MEIVWILGILAVLVGVGMVIGRQRGGGMKPRMDLPANERRAAVRAEKARHRSASGAYTGSWGYFGGGDGGGGFGGFDGGGCGGGDGGGSSC